VADEGSGGRGDGGDPRERAERLEAIGRLAGGLAHDFNNLLTVISTCSALLQRKVPAEGRDYLEQIDVAVKRGSELTRQLLAFARKDEVRISAVDVNDVVTGVVGLLRRLIGDEVELRANVDRSLYPVRGDRGRLEQVVMNLALNARDAMPDGGKLVLSTANVDLEGEDAGAMVVSPGHYVLLAVSDTGHGMDEQVKARVFEPFFTTKVGKGTGLGLATARTIVQQLGGDIAVESTVGEGSTFRVWLPAALGEAPERASDPPPRSRRAATGTLLLVDDDEAVRKSLGEYLRTHGFDVLEARSGREAIEMSEAHRGPIAVLVSDLVMPRMGGKTLAETLRHQRPTMKVIHLSGHSDSTLHRRGQADAGAVVLQKPFPPEALVSRLHTLIDEGGPGMGGTA
jgi:two-component system cell cycle sensor histidine kinase/response regulator CckA